MLSCKQKNKIYYYCIDYDDCMTTPNTANPLGQMLEDQDMINMLVQDCKKGKKVYVKSMSRRVESIMSELYAAAVNQNGLASVNLREFIKEINNKHQVNIIYDGTLTQDKKFLGKDTIHFDFIETEELKNMAKQQPTLYVLYYLNTYIKNHPEEWNSFSNEIKNTLNKDHYLKEFISKALDCEPKIFKPYDISNYTFSMDFVTHKNDLFFDLYRNTEISHPAAFLEFKCFDDNDRILRTLSKINYLPVKISLYCKRKRQNLLEKFIKRKETLTTHTIFENEGEEPGLMFDETEDQKRCFSSTDRCQLI